MSNIQTMTQLRDAIGSLAKLYAERPNRQAQVQDQLTKLLRSMQDTVRHPEWQDKGIAGWGDWETAMAELIDAVGHPLFGARKVTTERCVERALHALQILGGMQPPGAEDLATRTH